MKQLVKSKPWLLGMVLGAVAGFFYWRFFGCSSGHCMISSKPLNATAYGSLMGGLVFNIFKK